MTALAGFDVRTCARGLPHPWRLVVYFPRPKPSMSQWKGSLSSRETWISAPRDPLHGDLTDLGPSLIEQARVIAAALTEAGVRDLRVLRGHGLGRLSAALLWEGIDLQESDIGRDQASEEAEISGDAGQEIAALKLIMGVQ